MCSCPKCKLADFILNSACLYAASHGLTEDDVFDALVMAVEGVGIGEPTTEDEEDINDIEMITHTIN